MNHTKAIDVLLVEDSEEDVNLMIETLKVSDFTINLRVAQDGEEAMLYLKDLQRQMPDLVILDLNMPRKNGREVLLEMKKDPRLKVIPVVILTTSRSKEDISYCYQNYSNCYICKPLDFDNYFDVIREIERFWLKTVSLPNEHDEIGGFPRG